MRISAGVAALIPRRLRAGDLLGIVAPASPPSSDDKIQRSVKRLENRGYRVKLGKHLFARKGYLAGEDADRAADVNEMFADREVAGIFALRGGYGTPRLLPLIDYDAAARGAKVFVGFSDITALQLALFARSGLVTFSGPMPAADLCDNVDPFTEETFWRMVTEPDAKFAHPADAPLVRWGKGVGEGRLLGGTLSLVTSMMGTPYCPDFDGAVLTLEDVGERPHRLDRMLFQLRNGGVFGKVAAILLGQFTGCDGKETGSPQLTLDQILADVFGSCEKPILANLQYGHIPRKITLPFGARVRVNADLREITLLEAVVQ